jgi:hypothetical protein
MWLRRNQTGETQYRNMETAAPAMNRLDFGGISPASEKAHVEETK